MGDKGNISNSPRVLIPIEEGRDAVSRPCAANLAKHFEVVLFPTPRQIDSAALLRTYDLEKCTGFFTTRPRGGLEESLLRQLVNRGASLVFWYLEGSVTYQREVEQLSYLHLFDRGFCLSEVVCQEMVKRGIRCDFLPGAVDDSMILGPDDFGGPVADAIGFAGVAKPPRHEILLHLIHKGIPLRVVGPGWKKVLPRQFVFAERLTGRECALFYSGVKAALNIDEWFGVSNSGLGLRPFEILGSGSLCLTNPCIEHISYFSNLPPLFRVWENLNELVELAQRTIEEPVKRIDPGLFISEHTFGARMGPVARAFKEIQI